MRAKRLAKIIKLAEILHEPVEHECLRPLMAPTQKEELKGDKSLASPQTHNSGYIANISKTLSAQQLLRGLRCNAGRKILLKADLGYFRRRLRGDRFPAAIEAR